MCVQSVATEYQEANRVDGASAACVGHRRWKTLAQELHMETGRGRGQRGGFAPTDRESVPRDLRRKSRTGRTCLRDHESRQSSEQHR